MDKNAGYVLESIRDRIDIIKGYDIDTTSIESDFKQLEKKYDDKIGSINFNSQVAYMDTEIMSIEKTIDSFSTYLDNIIKGITIFEYIDSAYEFKMINCAGAPNRLKPNKAFQKHVERVASGMMDYGDFYVLGIRKNNIEKYIKKLYELIKEEYREFGSTSILTAVEGTKMDNSYLYSLVEKQVYELLKSDEGENNYKKEYLKGRVLENGKLSRDLLAIVSLVEVNQDEELIQRIINLTNKMDSYKSQLENEKYNTIFDYLHIDFRRRETFKRLLSSLLSFSVIAASNAALIKDRDALNGSYRKDYFIEGNDWKFLGGEVEGDTVTDKDGKGYLVEYSETRPDGTKVVREYEIDNIDSIKRGERIQVSEDMLKKEEIISTEGTDYSDEGYYMYKEYTQVPMKGSDFVLFGFLLAVMNAAFILLDNLIKQLVLDLNYETFIPTLEDIYNTILTIKEAIDKLKEHKDENKEIADNIDKLEEAYKSLTDKFSEAKMIFNDAETMAQAVNKGASMSMTVSLAKRFNKDQLVTFYYLLTVEKKLEFEKYEKNLLDNQRKLLNDFKEKDDEEQKKIVETYLKKLESKKAPKENGVHEKISEKKQKENEVKDSKKDKAQSIIEAIAGLSESIRLYSDFADQSMLDKLYHTVQIDEDTLFERVDDHFVIRKEFVSVLKFLNLAFIDTTDLKVSDIDFRGTNIRINPQVVYNKDLSYSKFDDENLFGDFTGCNLKGADISKESLPVGIYKSIIDKNTVLPKQEKSMKDPIKVLE